MISSFKENEMRDSGVIYKSQFEQIKKLFQQNKELAGELAISAIELVLTGEHSSDDFTVDLILTQNKVIVDRDAEKYKKSLEAKRQARIEKLQLYEIAEMLANGATQKVIADTLGEKPTTINNRVKVLREDFPEILEEVKNTKNPKNTKNTKDDNDNVNDNVNDNDNVISSSPSEKNWGGAPNPLPGAQISKEEEFKRMWGMN